MENAQQEMNATIFQRGQSVYVVEGSPYFARAERVLILNVIPGHAPRPNRYLIGYGDTTLWVNEKAVAADIPASAVQESDTLSPTMSFSEYATLAHARKHAILSSVLMLGGLVWTIYYLFFFDVSGNRRGESFLPRDWHIDNQRGGIYIGICIALAGIISLAAGRKRL